MRRYWPRGTIFQLGRWISSRYLLYNILLTVNNTVLYSYNSIERVDLKFTFLTTVKVKVKKESIKSKGKQIQAFAFLGQYILTRELINHI